jgi:uncharacterized protein (TIGR02646 family)
MAFTYNEMRKDPVALAAVQDGLLSEQGWICAYTGRRLDRNNFHIEHLLPQHPPPGTAFYHGHDTDYKNLVACWPEPNRASRPEYGAVLKDNWPNPDEAGDFLQPTNLRCGAAYTFERSGKLSLVNPADNAAGKTSEVLKLNHDELRDLRKSAIRGALEPKGRHLTLLQVQKLLREAENDEARLDAGHNMKLRAFCFAIRPQAVRLASKLAAIAASQRNK